MAAGSLGSQTGDSLYAPASAASLYTLRGTDGMESLANVMPLSWMQDYAGAITRSLSDLADILDVTTGTDPLDAERTAEADARRPKEWRDTLDPNALKGKRIGYYPAAFVDPFGTTGTVNAELAQLEAFRDAGATLVALSDGARVGPVLPANPANSSATPNLNFDLAYQGWAEYIKTHPNLPYQDPREILASQKRLPYRRSANGYTGTGGGSPAAIQAYKDYRAQAKVAVAQWLDAPPNPVVPGTTTASPGALDSVVYPGLKSTISLNDGNQAAFGRGDPPSNSAGTPTVAFPSGVNDEGEPTDLQIVGRAWDDGKLMGYAYAYDQTAKAHIEPTTAPRLTYKADPTPPVVEQPAPIAPEATVTPAPSPSSGTPASTPAKVVGPVLSNNAVRATKRRAVGFRVRCSPAPGAIRCRGSLKVTLAGRTIATRAFSIPAGRTVTVHVTLSKSAYRTLVARRSLRVAVRLRAPDSAGVTRVKTARITVRAPKR
jgi:amidase